jgi:hypothetical protein
VSGSPAIRGGRRLGSSAAWYPYAGNPPGGIMGTNDHRTNDECEPRLDDAFLERLDASLLERLGELEPLGDWVYEPLDASLLKRLGDDDIGAALLERLSGFEPASTPGVFAEHEVWAKEPLAEHDAEVKELFAEHDAEVKELLAGFESLIDPSVWAEHDAEVRELLTDDDQGET